MKNQYSDLHKARFAFLENRSQRSERFLPSLFISRAKATTCRSTPSCSCAAAVSHERGIDVDVIVGSKTKEMLILEKEMEAVAGNLYVCTDDGSYGHHGMVTSMIEKLVGEGKKYDRCVAIGPMIMMKFVCLLTKKLEIPTIVSMNPIMVDGTGMCGACRLQVGDEIKFACVDGPEFDGHLVDFDQAMKRQLMYKTEEGRAILKLQEGDTHHGGCGNCGGDN